MIDLPPQYSTTWEENLKYLCSTALSLPPRFSGLCEVVTDSNRFRFSPGGSTHHHAYPGGLLDHVAGVVRYCRAMNGPEVDWEVLCTAAIWHDFHKIYEYAWDEGEKKVNRLPYQKQIGHVVGSVIEFNHVAAGMGFDPGVRGQITHCMLAHHGRRDWGSPIEPTTKEAWILHSADMLSAKEGQ
jgi:3'-5' exoribonuclease